VVTLGNIIWFIFAGWWNFLVYAFCGCVCYITVIGIPIGKALFQYAKLMVLPYGKVIVRETDIKGKENVAAVRQVGGVIANLIWLPIGVILFICNVFLMIGAAVSIIGIPVAVVIARSSTFLIWPVGARVITKEEAEVLRMEKSMMKVAGTAMAVNAMATQQTAPKEQKTEKISQESSQAIESIKEGGSQAIESIKEGGSQAIESIKEGGSQAIESLKETGSRAVSVLAEKKSAGISALKERQSALAGDMQSYGDKNSLNEILEQLELKLYRNKVMAWIMPFLEYITLEIGVLFVIAGIIYVQDFHGASRFFYGLIYGISLASPLLCLSGILGMFKRNHLFVTVVLCIQLFASAALRIVGGPGTSIIMILCLLGITVWYVFTFIVVKNSAEKMKKSSAVFGNVVPESRQMAGEKMNVQDDANGRHFCSQCGAEYQGRITFCPKCGERVG